MAIARLTNYPSNTTTFLRGDGTWINPPATPFVDGSTVYTSATSSNFSIYATNDALGRFGFMRNTVVGTTNF